MKTSILGRMLGAALPLLFCGCVSSLHHAALRGETTKVIDAGKWPQDLSRCAFCAMRTAQHSLLGCAAHDGRIDMMKALIAKGARIDFDCAWFSPLHTAAAFGQTAAVELLLDHGADPNARSRRDRTPLWWAVNGDHLFAARALAGAGVDVDEALSHARKLRKADMVKLLEDAAADKGRMARAKARRKSGSRAAPFEALPEIDAAEKKADAEAQAGRQAQALSGYAEALKLCPSGSEPEERLRGKVLKLARGMSPPPAVPEEAQNHAKRAQAFLRRASDEAGFAKGVEEMEAALALAPWWPDAYFNLGVLQEKSKDYAGAVRSFKLYLEAAPRAPDAASVRDKILDIEVARELEGGRAAPSGPTRPTR